MKKPKIVLFNPKPTFRYFYRTLPIQLLAISSLIHKEFDIKIIQALPNKSYKENILNETKDAICFAITCMTGYQIKEALEMIEKVKQQNPDIPIILGGPHPTILPKQTLEHKNIDIVCIGQGQESFAEIVKALKDKKDLKNIKGIGYKKNNELIFTQPRPFKQISEFPKLPYHLIDINNFIIDNEYGSRTVNMITSYGCPYRCGFCAAHYGRKWTALPAERVLEDVGFLVKNYGINFILIQDSNFFVDKERVRKFCKGLLEKNINVKWGLANGRTDELIAYDEELWALMEKAGLKNLLIGAESGLQEVLDLITKDTTVEQTIELAKLCKKNNIVAYNSFVIGFPSGIPFKKELKSLYKIINKLYKIGNSYSLLFLYTPYPGTPLFELSLKKGFKQPQSLEEWTNFDFNVNLTPWISKKQAEFTELLNTYIFPFKSNLYKDRVKRKKHKYAFSFANFILHNLVSLRWKLKFFHLPIDYYLFKKFIKKKNEI